jgi:filamentous hemagglutinin family protein
VSLPRGNSNQKIMNNIVKKIGVWGILPGVAIAPFIFPVIFANQVSAQIIPDNTLPVNSTVTPTVSPDGENVLIIDGGTEAGGNLFHSFDEFSVIDTGAIFNNNPAIENIFSRVTGSSASIMNNFIQANGAANLFFLNPNGIIFGPNAQLRINGSFLASTGDRIIFDNDSFFSAGTDEFSEALLTINRPTRLQLGETPGDIQLQGVPLQLAPGQTLSLIGGNINLEGSLLQVPEGNINLVSGFDGEWSLIGEPTTIAQFGDINLSQGSLVDVSGDRSGNIEVQAGQMTIRDGSALVSITGSQTGGNVNINASEYLEVSGIDLNPDNLVPMSAVVAATAGDGDAGILNINTRILVVTDGAQISASSLQNSGGNAGTLSINASESIEVSNAIEGGAPTGLLVFTQGNGNGGNLSLETGHLLVRDGARVSTETFTQGSAGNLSVNAGLVELIGTTENLGEPSGLFAEVQFLQSSEATGTGGSLRVETSRLIIRDGARISASTFTGRNAGNLTIRASDSILLSGAGQRTPSALLTQVNPEGVGNAGNLTVETGQLIVEDQAQISSATFGAGSGGNITIDSQQVIVRSGGQIVSSTRGLGTAGSLTVNASESVTLAGTDVDNFPSALLASTQGPGNASNLQINTPELIISNGAKASVSVVDASNESPMSEMNNQIFGGAGNLEVNATTIQLDGGILEGKTIANSNGNITLNIRDLQLRNNSQITTDAQLSAGGNIQIDSGVIAALENSDITANATEALGGRVIIETLGIFGTEFRDVGSDTTSDVTATSSLGREFDGIVDINTPDIDPSRGLVELDEELVDIASLINEDPCRVAAGSQFVNTGKGGIPPNPSDPLTPQQGWEDLNLSEMDNQEVFPGQPESENYQNSVNDHNADNATLQEASGWEVDSEGNLVLTGETPISGNHSRSSNCAGISSKNLSIGQINPGAVSQVETWKFPRLEIVGSSLLTAAQIQTIAQEFTNKDLTFPEFLELRTQINELYAKSGYIGSGVVIPPQTVRDGVLVVQEVQNTLEDIKVNTQGRLNDNYVKGRLGIKPGELINRNELLEKLQLLQLDPMIQQVSAELSAGIESNTSLLNVTVQEAQTLTGQAIFDNGRSPSVGSFRRQGQLQSRNLLGLGDTGQFNYTNTDGSDTWNVGYTVPINSQNGTVSVNFGTSSSEIIEPPFDRVDIDADSRFYELTYRQPLIQSIQEKSDNDGQSSEFIRTEFALGFTASRQESETSLLGTRFPLSAGANDNGETRVSALRFFQEWTRQDAQQIFAARSQFSLGIRFI